jgi:hypothetical protein
LIGRTFNTSWLELGIQLTTSKTRTYSLSRKKFQERLETVCDTMPIHNTRATTVTTPHDQGHRVK